MRFDPNPLTVWDGATPTFDSDSIVWDTSTTSKAAQVALGNRIIALALLLKTYWAVNLVEVKDGVDYYLTTGSASGQDYFQAISGGKMRLLAPQIFTAQITQPQYKTTKPALTYAPDDLPVDTTVSATIFGMTKGLFNTLITMLGIVAFSFWLVAKQPNLTRHILYIDGIMVLFFTRIGGIVPIWATIIGVGSLLIIGYMIFYEKSSV
jgi:hypothetical protein